jgi:hypothetical protein
LTIVAKKVQEGEMTLGHQRSSLHPIEFEVTLRYRQRRFPVAHARDLSPEGLYVKTTKLTLPVGTLIEIELDRWDRQWLIPAVVVHADANGVELMFRTSQPELYRYETSVVRDTRIERLFCAEKLPVTSGTRLAALGSESGRR